MNTARRNTPLTEARLGARLAGALTARTEALPHDVSERLRFAREQALAKVARSAKATATGAVVTGVSSSGAGILSWFSPRWHRAASVIPLALLIAGLVAIDRWTVREQVLAAAEIDAQLLGDALPPAAYSDPGFAEYLRSTPP